MSTVVAQGSPLPELKVAETTGAVRTLLSLTGERGLAVFFMRAGNCPVCLRHARRLAKLQSQLSRQGITAAVVVPGDADSARAVAAKAPGIAVVGGTGVSSHRAVGLDRVLMQQSGTLLVDPEGTIRYVRAAYMPTGSFSPDELLAAAGKMADPPPGG